MHPLLYDFKKAIRSRGMLAVVAFMVLFSLAIIPLIFSSQVSSSAAISYSYTEYSATDGYHVLLYVYNAFGQPLAGAQVNVSLQSGSFSHIFTSNSSGFVQFVVPVNSSIPSQLITMPVGSNLLSAFPLILNPTKNGHTQPPAEIGYVTDQTNSSKMDILVFASGPYFEDPNYQLYYNFSSSPAVNQLNSSQMRFLADINSKVTILRFDVPSNETNSLVIFSVFDKNGTSLVTAGVSANFLAEKSFQASPKQVAASFVSGVLALFVPLMAILGSYSVYGRERVTGVLESVLARPVTRKNLLTSRFIAGLLASATAIILTVLIADGIIYYKLGQSLDASFIFTSWASLVVEVAAFMGFIFLLSQLTKSTGALIGAGIGLFLVLDFLWNLILFFAVSLTGATLGSAVSYRIEMLLDFLNPAQYLNLVQVYQTRSILGIPINPSDYGITPLTLISDGIIWLVLPALVSIWLVSRRD
ncbi:MAG: ABC transporter permease subunit [Conexivisphaerales archaeon]